MSDGFEQFRSPSGSSAPISADFGSFDTATVAVDENIVLNSTQDPKADPSASSNDANTLTMQFHDTVFGVSARVLLDTGAGANFISHDFARRPGISVIQANSYTGATSATHR